MGLRFQATLLSLGIVLWGTAAWAVDLAKLPYRIGADGRVSTDVYLDGHGPFNFVLDTASSRTMLFEHLRQALGLTPPAGSAMLKVYAMNDIGSAVPVKPDALGLDKQTIKGLTMGVLPDDVAPAQGQQGADGILGLDALSHYFMVMDHDTLQVKLMDPSDPGATAYRQWPSEALTPYQARDMDITFWWMSARFGGKRVTALLDMGSGITMLNWQAAEQLGLHRADFLKSKVPEELRDALGTLEPVVLVKDLSIQVDDHTFPDQNVIVANAKVFQYFGLDDRPAAIIGPALMRSNSLAIDFGERRIYIGPTTPIPASGVQGSLRGKRTPASSSPKDAGKGLADLLLTR
jgi:predicted aspartyl protease